MKAIILSLFISILSLVTYAQEKDSVLIQLQHKIETATKKQERIEFLLEAGKYCLNNNLTLSEKYFGEANQLIGKNDFVHLSDLYEQYVNLNRKKGNYSMAVQYGLNAKMSFEKIKDTLGIIRSLISLGITGRYRDENTQSIKYYHKAIELSKIVKDSSLLGQSYNMMGISYRRLKKRDSALISYHKAMQIFQALDEIDMIVGVKNNLAIFYSSQRDFERSLPLLLSNLEYNKRVNNTMSISIGYFNIAMDYLKTKKNAIALQYADSSYAISKKLGYKFRIAKAAELKGKIKARQGEYKEALKYTNIFHALSDSIFNVESEKKLKEFELKREFDLERREIEIRAEAQRSKNQLYILLLGSLLILGTFIAYLMKRNYKGKIKYVATKLEKEKLKKELLDEKVKVSEAELKWLVADNKMRLTYLQQFYDQLKLDYESSGLKETNTYIRSLMIRLQQQITTEEKLTSIQSKIEDVNRGFESKIISQFPSLTKSEREVCVLLRVNLSIKEMASVRNTTVDSIKSIRYRLRKKLEIPKSIELESFIQGL
ncbi:hypothetical protein AAON49_05515 [Pseudotenacibaculum sp. MALMAid0570]|uniref:tetratricopeptide repeat protein n=1 Tax=Pseudotenacibaculum sp. MALMAid0570 TaxID=3143938 RepID=UPI0032DE8787